MIKRVSMFSLAEGKDTDNVWKYWVETHAPNIKTIPGLKKYVISRVIKSIPGPDGTEKKPSYWGMVEMWFDTMEAHNAAFKMPPKDEFGTMVCNPQAAFVEEYIVVK